jgi:hypothetical protein
MKSVYSAVRTGALNEALCATSVKGQLWNFNRYFETKSALFCDLTQHRVGISYRRFVTTDRSQLQGATWPFKKVPERFPQTSVSNYHCTLYNVTEELTSHPHGSGSLKSRPVHVFGDCLLLLIIEDRPDVFSRNVGKELPVFAA